MKKTLISILIIISLLICLCLSLTSCTGTSEPGADDQNNIPEDTNFFDGFNESVYVMPEVIEFGDARIESAIVHEENGEYVFQLALYFEMNYDPIMDFEEYRNLEVIFSDGAILALEEGWLWNVGHRGNFEMFDQTSGNDAVCSFQYRDFPNKHEFSVRTVNGEVSAEIALKPIRENLNITITENENIRAVMIPAAERSRLYSYHIEVMQPSTVEIEAKTVGYNITGYRGYGDEIKNTVYFKDGTILPWPLTFPLTGGFPIYPIANDAEKHIMFGQTIYRYHFIGDHIFSYDFHDNDAHKEIGMIAITELNVSLNFVDVLRDENGMAIADIPIADLLSGEYTWEEYEKSIHREFNESAKASIPIPKDGERVYYDTPFTVAQIGDFALQVEAIERYENYLILYFGSEHTIYSGSENITPWMFSFFTLDPIRDPEVWQILSPVTDSYMDNPHDGVHYSAYIIPEDHTGDILELYIENLSYNIHGYWEIVFN